MLDPDFDIRGAWSTRPLDKGGGGPVSKKNCFDRGGVPWICHWTVMDLGEGPKAYREVC